MYSNAPLPGGTALPDSTKSFEHTAVDLGEEEFTVGRPHPMIDNDLRIRRILQEARDPEVAVILLDVVLGYGAHPDPASELGKAVEEAQKLAHAEGRELTFVASVTGTEEDPQCLSRTIIHFGTRRRDRLRQQFRRSASDRPARFRLNGEESQ